LPQTQLRYHVPLLGYLGANLHAESHRIYLALEAAGEVDRLKRLDHLGLMRFAWEGAHHSRWEYTVLILSLVERCKAVSKIHLASRVKLRDATVSSGYELLKAWALLLNTGHLVWTFAAERALLLETWADRNGARESYLAAFDRPDVRTFAEAVLRKGRTYQFFQTLAFIRLAALVPDDGSGNRRLCMDALEAYVTLQTPNEQLARIKRIYSNLRRLAYMALDTHYTPSVDRVDLTQLLTDGESLARLALREETRQSDELDGLGAYLDRETYLGWRVMEEMAGRERQLRQRIRLTLRSSSLHSTIESLASGDLQGQVVPSPVKTVLRVTGDAAIGLAGFWPDSGNGRVEQERLERELPMNSGAMGLYWKTASANEWVLQTFTTADRPSATIRAYLPVWKRATEAHAHARDELETKWWADVYSERLASALLLQSLPLFFRPDLTWEWGIRGALGEALLVPRAGARRLIEREVKGGSLAVSRLTELSMLARTLRRRPSAYALVSVAPLIAYEGADQVAEVDGCFVEWQSETLRLTVVEAKKMRSGALTAAKSSLGQAMTRLGTNPAVSPRPISAERLPAGVVRAWIELEIQP
jgi:hypothetical protein